MNQFSQMQELIHGYQSHLKELQEGTSLVAAATEEEDYLGVMEDLGDADLYEAEYNLPVVAFQEEWSQPRMQGQPMQTSQTYSQHTSNVTRSQQAWANAWQLANDGEFEQAYRIVLKECDDIHLLKLVSKTGSVVRHLSEKTSRRVLNRMNRIMRSGSIQTMAIAWFSEANSVGILDRIEKRDKNEYLDSLYTCYQKADNEMLKQQAKRTYKEIRETQARRD